MCTFADISFQPVTHMNYAKAKALFVGYTSSQSYNTLADIQTTLYARQLQNDGAQSSESTARTRFQSSPDSPVLSMSDISNSTTQQHTPGLELSTATSVLSTSDISNSLQPQQHAPGLGMVTSDSPVLSTSDISNGLQPTPYTWPRA